MKEKFTARVGVVTAALLAAFMISAPVNVSAATNSALMANAANQVQSGVNQVGGDDNTTQLPEFITSIINVMLYIIGSIAVLMIIIGGIRYVTSNGDQANVKAAKDTIFYAVIGLILAVLAYAIVNFVIQGISSGSLMMITLG